jgi:hypothetical protein
MSMKTYVIADLVTLILLDTPMAGMVRLGVGT